MILRVGAFAAGGACVARAEDGRVVFVRLALPGETVRVEVRSEGAKFLRADAVEVLTASPDRVEPPCPFFGRCGGCDLQHATGDAQRRLKAGVVSEQLRRVAGVDRDVVVEELPGGLLGWRTRVQWAVSPAGRAGLHPYRSHEVLELDQCPISAPGATEPLALEWPGVKSVEAFAVGGQVVLDVDGPVPAGLDVGVVQRGRAVRVPHGVRTEVLGRSFEIAGGGFWQVHPAAPSVLGAGVLELLAAQPGESVLDLYSGVGLFASLLGAAVGPSGSVLAVEGSARASADAARNTADQPWVKVRTEQVTPGLVARTPADLVVLDPPRAGAGVDVIRALAGRRPRAVAWVSCDPATFARDLRVVLEAGWTMPVLRALDMYPMTEHVETLALLVPPA